MAMCFVDARSGERRFGPFDWASPFAGERAIVQVGDRYGAIDRHGAMKIEPRFDILRSFNDGFAAARQPDGKMGFVDEQGQWVAGPSWDYTTGFAHGVGMFVKGGEIPECAIGFQIEPAGGKWGAVDTQGKVVLEPRFDHIASGEMLLLVNEGGRSSGWGVSGGLFRYLSREGVDAFGGLQGATPFVGGIALARHPKGKWAIYDHSGTVLATPEFAYDPDVVLPGPFIMGKARVELPGKKKLGTKLAVLDPSGAIWLEDLGFFDVVSEGLAIVNVGGEQVSGRVRGGKWGWIDWEKNIVSRREWKDVLGLFDDVGVVSLGKGKGIQTVNRAGDTLRDFDGDWARPTLDGMVLIQIPEEKKAKKKKASKKKKTIKKSAKKTKSELAAAKLLKDWENGQIDNAFDVMADLVELQDKLPATSELRPRFDQMFEEMEAICADADR